MEETNMNSEKIKFHGVKDGGTFKVADMELINKVYNENK